MVTFNEDMTYKPTNVTKAFAERVAQAVRVDPDHVAYVKTWGGYYAEDNDGNMIYSPSFDGCKRLLDAVNALIAERKQAQYTVSPSPRFQAWQH